MISKIERIIAFRYLKPKKKEGFLKTISVFSFTGIALGVAILIIVMSVMNGFRAELINKILGFNPHIIVKPYSNKINKDDLNNLDLLKEDISRTAFTFSGQAILINRENTTGVLVRSYLQNDIRKVDLIKNKIDVLLDDTEEHLSAKFKKFDLIGIPYQIILGSKTTDDKFEFKEVNGKTETLSLEEIKNKLLNKRNLN